MVETLINSNQINLGNESAIDLLLEQNTAKANLATNLSGKGITANASTETLNELVNKVANIQSTSDREGDYLVGIRPDFSAIKLKYWFGKKTITKRTVSVNGTEKEFFLFA